MVGAQGKGRRVDGAFSGVGYYWFPVRSPVGIWGEAGERFIGHRKVFAYGRLKGVAAGSAPVWVASMTPPAIKHAAHPAASTSAAHLD
jgi:hypothetical protein